MLLARSLPFVFYACLVGITLPACAQHRLVAQSMLSVPDLAIPTTPEATEPVGMLPVTKRNVVASLRRTACFGSCPVFLAEVWSDGQVTWQGERYTPQMGKYSAQVSPDWIAELLQAGEKAGYFDLAKQYPSNGHLVPDLPQTITMLRQGHRMHRVVDNADAPLALLRFEREWLEKLEGLDWKPVEQ